MHIALFTVILLIVLFIATIVVCAHFYVDGNAAIIILIMVCIGSLIVPDLLFNKYAESSDRISNSYELLQNNYIQPQSGKYSGLLVSYINEDNILKKYNVNSCEVIYYDGNPKIEFVRYEWGFLYKTKPILYLSE